MIRLIGLLSLLFLIPLIPSTASAYQKGIALGLYAKDLNYSYEQDLREIKTLGADHVSLVVSWYQKDITSTEIYPHWEPVGDFDTIPDKKIIEVIREAHRLGLKVLLFPILRLEERKEKEWRGVVSPHNLAQWLESYKRFTLHYARIAAAHRVELFSVGSELCSVEGQVKFWEKLISKIRGFYQGKLLYSANWDHYKKIDFWEKLDYLGLNGYYELTDHKAPTIQELMKKWWEIDNELAGWQERHRKKIIFTEIGYPSIDGACHKPWDYTRETVIDLEEQALCYEAFFLSWGRS
ncbi:MAG: glycoside hydrolase family 113, partial [Thermodesulfobacteriota bacterium]